MRAATAPSSSDLSAHLARAALALLVLPVLLAGALPAAAQVRDEEAHGLYMAGEAAYEAGNFEDALGYFQRSYELSPHPELLFNIAQAADRARLDEVALDALRRYLDSPVTIENREQLEARVRALEAAVARGEAAAAPSDDAVADTTEETAVGGSAPSAGPDVAGVALAIGGGVLVLASPVLLGLGAVDTAALADPHDGETYAQALARQDVGTGLVAGGFVTLGVGLVVLAVGTAILASGSGSGSVDGGRARLTPNGLAISF